MTQKRFYQTFRQQSSIKKGRNDMKKAFAVALLVILAVSSLSFAVASASAKGQSNKGWGWNMGAWKKNGDTIPFQRSWVRLNGIVETWGTQEVNGSLSVNARTINSDEHVRQAAFATAIWSNTTNTKANGNFSYSFYAAKLVQANISQADFEENDYFLNGTWNVFNVTITQTLIKTGDLQSGYTGDRHTETYTKKLATNASGALNVTDGTTTFLLSIEGIEDLTGVVGRARMAQMTFNQFKVNEDDTETVTRVDLKTLARNLGARPGWGAYDSNMDFNCNYKIDIADLSTVAANVEST